MKKQIVYFLGILFLMVSCYPYDTVYYEDLDLVYTNYTDTFDFNSQQTYAMPDKIVKITGNLVEGEEPEFVKEPYNTQILDKIESNMEALGWSRVENPESADLTLLPASWTNTTIYSWNNYYCWYYYYYCGWGYYYPSTVSYTTGTLVMSLVASGEDYIDPSPVWIGTANGVMSGYSDINRINNAIDQAFSQSSYLHIK